MSKSKKMRIDGDEVDLKYFLIPIWKKRKRVLITIIIFAFIGVFIAYSLENRYTADTVFLPQGGEGSEQIGGQLGGLASLAGINLNSGGGGALIFPPALYPNLLDNIDLQLELLSSKIYLQDLGDSVTYRVYYDSVYSPGIMSILLDYTIGLPGKIFGALKGGEDAPIKRGQDKYYRISKKDYGLIKQLKADITLKPNDADGYVSMSFTMPDPDHAAQMAGHLERILHNNLVDFRLEKIIQELEYLEGTYAEKKKDYLKAQKELSDFKDRNINLITTSSQENLQNLQNQFDLTFEIYKNVSASLEQKKIEKSKNTPLIKTIKPIVIPFKRSSPNRPQVLIIFVILGFVFSSAHILLWPAVKATFSSN